MYYYYKYSLTNITSKSGQCEVVSCSQTCMMNINENFSRFRRSKNVNELMMFYINHDPLELGQEPSKKKGRTQPLMHTKGGSFLLPKGNEKEKVVFCCDWFIYTSRNNNNNKLIQKGKNFVLRVVIKFYRFGCYNISLLFPNQFPWDPQKCFFSSFFFIGVRDHAR